MQPATVANTEPPLFRKLEDLTNELAYINHYPERFTHVERLARKIEVLRQIKYIRWLLAHWAMPVEQEIEA